MSIHMSECHTIDEVGQKIGRYIYNIEDMHKRRNDLRK